MLALEVTLTQWLFSSTIPTISWRSIYLNTPAVKVSPHHLVWGISQWVEDRKTLFTQSGPRPTTVCLILLWTQTRCLFRPTSRLKPTKRASYSRLSNLLPHKSASKSRASSTKFGFHTRAKIPTRTSKVSICSRRTRHAWTLAATLSNIALPTINVLSKTTTTLLLAPATSPRTTIPTGWQATVRPFDGLKHCQL